MNFSWIEWNSYQCASSILRKKHVPSQKQHECLKIINESDLLYWFKDLKSIGTHSKKIMKLVILLLYSVSPAQYLVFHAAGF
jgi:hypothetical protein